MHVVKVLISLFVVGIVIVIITLCFALKCCRKNKEVDMKDPDDNESIKVHEASINSVSGKRADVFSHVACHVIKHESYTSSMSSMSSNLSSNMSSNVSSLLLSIIASNSVILILFHFNGLIQKWENSQFS